MLAALVFVCLANTPVDDCSFDTAVAWEIAHPPAANPAGSTKRAGGSAPAWACGVPGQVRVLRTSLRASYIKRVCLSRAEARL